MQRVKNIQSLQAFSSRRIALPSSLRSVPTKEVHVNPNPIIRGFSRPLTIDNGNNSYGQGKIKSNADVFRSIPVDGSILAHIRSIGVGLRSKKMKKKRKNTDRATKGILSEEDEAKFFERDGGRRNRKGGNRRSNTLMDDENMRLPSYLPPPPFASFAGNKEKDVTGDGRVIKRLPVKVLGSVGSFDEEMPRASKGLPEVAIVGRSNVGKSTLLNALLYGNQFVAGTETRKYVRGKTPDATKMQRGVKAICSPKPGETKRITFYQLSSQIQKSPTERKKMSLLLADLPGYGFAFASEERAEVWQGLMKSFILHRGKSLKRILLLVDARHGFKKADFDFLELLQDGLKERLTNDAGDKKMNEKTSKRWRQKKKLELPPIQLCLTKCDLVPQVDLARRVVQVRQDFSDTIRRQPSALPIMLVSAKAGLGFNNLRGNRACGGILELQRELAALIPSPK